jgi:hypothetical protein
MPVAALTVNCAQKLKVDFCLLICRNIFPPNLVQAAIQQYQTELVKPENGTADLSTWNISGRYTDGEIIGSKHGPTT